jgi:hypothetical protein
MDSLVWCWLTSSCKEQNILKAQVDNVLSKQDKVNLFQIVFTTQMELWRTKLTNPVVIIFSDQTVSFWPTGTL